MKHLNWKMWIILLFFTPMISFAQDDNLNDYLQFIKHPFGWNLIRYDVMENGKTPTGQLSKLTNCLQTQVLVLNENGTYSYENFSEDCLKKSEFQGSGKWEALSDQKIRPGIFYLHLIDEKNVNKSKKYLFLSINVWHQTMTLIENPLNTDSKQTILVFKRNEKPYILRNKSEASTYAMMDFFGAIKHNEIEQSEGDHESIFYIDSTHIANGRLMYEYKVGDGALHQMVKYQMVNGHVKLVDIEMEPDDYKISIYEFNDEESYEVTEDVLGRNYHERFSKSGQFMADMLSSDELKNGTDKKNTIEFHFDHESDFVNPTIYINYIISWTDKKTKKRSAEAFSAGKLVFNGETFVWKKQ